MTRILMLHILVCLAICRGAVAGPEPGKRVAAFYNVENLFDTINDPGFADGDFTPGGVYRRDSEKYYGKIDRLARVISEIGPDFIGLAEVENEGVLSDLVRSGPLRPAGYDFLHIPSGDYRGMDVAFLYKPYRFRPHAFRSVRSPLPGTRDILHIHGSWTGVEIHILVCHLPSMGTSPEYRKRAASFLGSLIDSLCHTSPGVPVLTMGDFNANPGTGIVSAVTKDKKRPGYRTESPFRRLHRRGYGSYRYSGKWNMLDMILVTRPEDPEVLPEAAAHVFIRDYLIQNEGDYRGYPLRTYSGYEYIAGYSDHLPVFITFVF